MSRAGGSEYDGARVGRATRVRPPAPFATAPPTRGWRCWFSHGRPRGAGLRLSARPAREERAASKTSLRRRLLLTRRRGGTQKGTVGGVSPWGPPFVRFVDCPLSLTHFTCVDLTNVLGDPCQAETEPIGGAILSEIRSAPSPGFVAPDTEGAVGDRGRGVPPGVRPPDSATAPMPWVSGSLGLCPLYCLGHARGE